MSIIPLTDNNSKTCCRCGSLKPLSDFYKRSGINSYTSECKVCMNERSKTSKRLPATTPRVKSEVIAIDYLRSKGIYAVPGKSVSSSHVDVVAWGCVGIEVKYAKFGKPENGFQFNASAPQVKRGHYLGEVVMLICDYGDRMTFHFFQSDDEVFYIDRKIGEENRLGIYERGLKYAVSYVLSDTAGSKHGGNRVVMTNEMMASAQDAYELIELYRQAIGNSLVNEAA
jgi:hypothetical protein